MVARVCRRSEGRTMNHHGWHRALDAQMDTHKYYITNGLRFGLSFFASILELTDKVDAKKRTEDEAVAELESIMYSFVQTLYRGDTIYVTEDIQHVLMQAAQDLPEDVCFDTHTLISPIGFCMFEEPMYGEDRSGRKMGIHALAWQLHKFMQRDGELGDAILLYFLTDPDDMNDEINQEITPLLREFEGYVPPLAISHWYPAIDGKRIPQPTEEIGSTLIPDLLKLFVSMQLLAQQRIGEPMKIAPERHARKRFMRDYPELPERLITLITLRRKSAKREENGEPVPWTRRWIVRGHWRRQWYPSLKKHDWKYIYEYIKGPEDKPLVITERRVFNFRR